MQNLVEAVEKLDPLVVTGRVAAVSGLLIEARGGMTRLAVGARAEIQRRGAPPLPAEVVGFRDSRALLMPFGPVEGVAPGATIHIEPEGSNVRPTTAWLGRIVNAFGEPSQARGIQRPAYDGLARSHPQRLRGTDRRQGPSSRGARRLPPSRRATARPRARPCRGPPRPWRPIHERLHDLLPGPASRGLCRLGRRQVRAPLHAGAAGGV